MENNLKKKYGLMTGICMVVGIVIGSGIFFKASSVLAKVNGNLSLAMLAWIIGGFVMVVSAYSFSLMAAKVEKGNGIVDYVETASGEKVGYYTGWYFTTIYYPIIVSIVGYLTSTYLFALFQIQATNHALWGFTFLLITLSFIFNAFAPIIAGYFQISTTIIKLIPIFIIGIIGVSYGLIHQTIKDSFLPLNFEMLLPSSEVNDNFPGALLATVFSYEGWIIATSINSEIRNSKKNLPLALVIGSILVVLAYMGYNFGISAILGNSANVINEGMQAPIVAISKIIPFGGKILFNLFIVISCLGTLNGLTMACSRGMYSLSIRKQGIQPFKTCQLHAKFNISIRSNLFGYGISLLYCLIWYLSMEQILPFTNLDELGIAFVYFIYIFVYIYIIKRRKDLNIFHRYIIPSLSIFASLFLILGSSGLYNILFYHTFDMFYQYLYFMVLVGISFLVATYFYIKNKKNQKGKV